MTDQAAVYGGVCYIEIPAPDLEVAKIFYSTLFGWTIEDSERGKVPYAMFEALGMSGGLDSRREPIDKGVLLYLEVEDILATLGAVEKAGGLTVMQKSSVIEGSDQFGFTATFKDPNGNLLGLWARN